MAPYFCQFYIHFIKKGAIGQFWWPLPSQIQSIPCSRSHSIANILPFGLKGDDDESVLKVPPPPQKKNKKQKNLGVAILTILTYQNKFYEFSCQCKQHKFSFDIKNWLNYGQFSGMWKNIFTQHPTVFTKLHAHMVCLRVLMMIMTNRFLTFS